MTQIKSDPCQMAMKNRTGSGNLTIHKQGSNAYLSLSPTHCPDMSEMLLKRTVIASSPPKSTFKRFPTAVGAVGLETHCILGPADIALPHPSSKKLAIYCWVDGVFQPSAKYRCNHMTWQLPGSTMTKCL